MTPLQAMISEHEGYRQHIYKDTVGVLTIGYGTNISQGLSERQAALLRDDKIAEVTADLLHRLPFFNSLSVARQNVLVDMGYNLGVPGLLRFKKMIEAVGNGQWNTAATEMLDSKWAGQVGKRAQTLAAIMRSGVM
jgi:lysozyme